MTAAATGTRVMQFVTVFEAGGTERQFMNLAHALCDRGIDLRFGCLQRSGRMLAELEGRNAIQVSVRFEA